MIKFLNLIKKGSKRIAIWIFFTALLSLAFYSSMVDNTMVIDNHDMSEERYSELYSISYQKAIEKSRKSAVRIISIDTESGMVSTFSGTYIEAYDSYFVVTVAHGMVGPCEFTKIVYNQELHECLKIIEINELQDYAIIQIDEIKERSPIKIPQDLPRNHQWRGAFTLLNKVVYTGYPNSIGPLSIGGSVAGVSGTQFIYLDSYAWEGSSGSGVFDSKGKYIGYVVAIDVGATKFGIQALNNVVLVIPAFKIDWTKTITEAE
jgi:hypothetical protein